VLEHVPYPKIPSVDRPDGPSIGGPWVATEKLHGAQLVVAHDGERFAVGKRKAWLDGGEAFFGWQLLRSRLEQAARAALSPGAVAVRLYGELYGGGYPHTDVPPAPGMSPVQTGIWYSPEVRFALFDVLRHDRPDAPGRYLVYRDLHAIADRAGLDVVPLLGRGPRATLDGLPTRFPTRVPQRLGLPELPGNLAEGLVLRPDERLTPQRRPIVKRKIAEFDERRFGESQPWDERARLDPAELREWADALVNDPRLASARSKVGADRPEELLDEVVLDVMVDLSEAFPAATAALTGDQEADLHAHIRELGRTRLTP
jgi:Rnl2 family RNA ligase